MNALSAKVEHASAAVVALKSCGTAGRKEVMGDSSFVSIYYSRHRAGDDGLVATRNVPGPLVSDGKDHFLSRKTNLSLAFSPFLITRRMVVEAEKAHLGVLGRPWLQLEVEPLDVSHDLWQQHTSFRIKLTFGACGSACCS